ncbi:hypothetical protein F0562_015113 [Nyssa sinensis]|uniref:Uncharacterized protein n=1 Tax=Nyssa sinensis TaxID=561372 RepID=A0A5J4ZGF3_9ASTE|nr:hypothetical protein F0562_015113 [Nyssa sinensis]
MESKKVSLFFTLVLAMVLVATTFVPLAFARELTSDGVTTRKDPLINIMISGVEGLGVKVVGMECVNNDAFAPLTFVDVIELAMARERCLLRAMARECCLLRAMARERSPVFSWGVGKAPAPVFSWGVGKAPARLAGRLGPKMCENKARNGFSRHSPHQKETENG